MEMTETPLIPKDKIAELLEIKYPYKEYTVTASDSLTGWSSGSATWEPASVTYPASYSTSITTDDLSTILKPSPDIAKKEDVEKLERHIEELEEDIAFFEEERKQQAILIASYESRIHDLETTVKTLGGVVASLKSDYTDLLNMFSDDISVTTDI